MSPIYSCYVALLHRMYKFSIFCNVAAEDIQPDQNPPIPLIAPRFLLKIKVVWRRPPSTVDSLFVVFVDISSSSTLRVCHRIQLFKSRRHPGYIWYSSFHQYIHYIYISAICKPVHHITDLHVFCGHACCII